MHGFRFCVLWFALLKLAACTAVVDPPEAGSETKWQVTAFISPQDSVARVDIFESTLFGKSYSSGTSRVVSGAKSVLISGKNGSLQLTFAADAGYYRQKVPENFFETNEPYTLSLTLPDGSQVEGTCTIPPAPAPLSVKIEESLFTYSAQFEWQDQPGTINYYRYIGEIYYPNESPNGCFAADQKGNTCYRYLAWESGAGIPGLLSDQALNGKMMTSPSGSFHRSQDGVSFYGNLRPNTRLRAYLLNVDKIYYEFHKQIYRLSAETQLSEPVVLISNLSGANGVFAGFNQTSIDLPVN